MQIAADNYGGVWVGSRTLGEIWHYQNGSPQPLSQPALQNKFFNLLVDRQSRLWVSTDDALFRYDGHTWLPVDTPPIGMVGELAPAPDGRLWFVGERGIAVYDPQRDTTP